MNDSPKKRGLFQLHLSTCVVLLFVAGGILDVNFRETIDSTLDPPWNCIYGFGWPFILYHPDYQSPWSYFFHDFGWHWRQLLYDVAVAISIIVAAALICEWLNRLKKRRLSPFPFHFSTGIVLLFVAGILFLVNVRDPAVSWRVDPPYIPVINFGWPFGYGDPNHQAWPVLGNVIVAISIIVAAALICEWLKRHLKLPPVRFSLGTMVIGVLLVSSGCGLWWRWKPWVLERRLSNSEPNKPFDISPDGRYVAAGSPEALVRLWKTEDWSSQVLTSKKTLPPDFAVSSLAFSSDSTRLVGSGTTYEKDRSGHTLNAICWLIPAGTEDPYDNSFFSEDREHLRLFARHCNLNLGDEQPYMLYVKDKPGVELGGIDEIGIAVSPSATLVMTWQVDGTVLIYSAETRDVVYRLQIGPLSDADFAGDDRICSVNKNDKSPAKILDFTGRSLCTLDYDYAVYRPLFSPDGKRIIARTMPAHAWDSGEWLLFAYPSGELLQRIGNNGYEVSFSHDSSRILAGSVYSDYYSVFDAKSGNILTEIGEQSMQFIPNQERILACDERGLCVLCRRRPEYWWGVAWLPEFWLALVFGCTFIWSVRRDWRWARSKRAGKDSPTPPADPAPDAKGK